MEKKRIQKANRKRQEEYEILSNIKDFFIQSFDPECHFSQFAYELIIKNVREPNEQDEITALVDPLLSMGFLVGQLFEVTDPEIREQIELMKKLIRAKGLLSCIPRERKPAATLTK